MKTASFSLSEPSPESRLPVRGLMTTSPHYGSRSYSSFECMFAPRVVALVGASERSLLSKQFWHAIKAGGFGGKLFFVNPGRSEVFGAPFYPSLDALPAAIDLCLIAVSERAVLAVLENCAAHGVPSAMLFTLFGNTPEGRELRAAMRAFLSQTTMLVCGSGTFGLMNLDASFTPLLSSPPNTLPGSTALICQSGGILNALSA